MATSSAVSSTDSVLAAQYNDLRTDVLSTHTHDGTDGTASLGGALGAGIVQARVRTSALKILNPAQTFEYLLAASAITANRTVTLPLLTGNDTLVTEAFAQTLSNKALSLVTSIKAKSGDEVVNNSTTLQDDDTFQFTLVNTERYMLIGLLPIISGTIPDFKFQWGGTASFSVRGCYSKNMDSVSEMNMAYMDETTAYQVDGTGGDRGTLFVASIYCTGNGTFIFRWAQTTLDPSDTRIRNGAWMMLIRTV